MDLKVCNPRFPEHTWASSYNTEEQKITFTKDQIMDLWGGAAVTLTDDEGVRTRFVKASPAGMGCLK